MVFWIDIVPAQRPKSQGITYLTNPFKYIKFVKKKKTECQKGCSITLSLLTAEHQWN